MAATVTVVKEGANEDVFFNPAWTGAQAKKEIRERFLLQGGGLEDVDTGFTVGDDDNLGKRQLRFVGGRSTGDFFSQSLLSIFNINIFLLLILFQSCLL